jgi:hypothetical protein
MLAALPAGLSQADGMTGVIIFAVVYAIVSILGKMKQAGQKGPPESAPPSPEQQQRRLERQRLKQQRLERARQARPASPARPAPPRPSTQTEGARLEDLLRVLTEAAGVPVPEGPTGRRSSVPLESAEEVEERESLEREEQVISLETDDRRPLRKEVDFDDDAEALVQRRIAAAQARDRSLNREDHRKFDSRIRAVPDHTRVARPKPPTLRQAIVWREILGPPVGLRGSDDPQY